MNEMALTADKSVIKIINKNKEAANYIAKCDHYTTSNVSIIIHWKYIESDWRHFIDENHLVKILINNINLLREKFYLLFIEDGEIEYDFGEWKDNPFNLRGKIIISYN